MLKWTQLTETMESLNASLKKYIRRSSLGEQIVVSQLFELVSEELSARMGAEAAREIKLISITHGALKLYAPTSAHRQEIAMHAAPIIAAVKAKFKKRPLQRIVFANQPPDLEE